MELYEFYQKLLTDYGPQGWWPLLDIDGTNPTKTGSHTGYHIGEYDWPKTEKQRFEICVGAILTQNTAWPNVEKALKNLQQLDTIDAKTIGELDDEALKTAIRPSGYFNAKAKKLRFLSRFFLELNGSTPTRKELLSVWGIGPETADSILLYAYKQTEMVIDTYTKRILSSMAMISAKASYDTIKQFCVNALPHDLFIYQEFHALIVEHAKRLKHTSRKRNK